jgi:hypothetical protein
MSKQSIWSYLKAKGLSDEAVAGIMGNMEAESNCESCRLQGDFGASRQMSKHYADMVNSGTMTAETFAFDSKGWGLCQWTFNSRKLNLLKSCQSQGKGIEDETAQLDFFMVEMQEEYPTVWKALQTCKDIRTAAYLVCHNYERPAFENTEVRTSLGQKIYDEFHGTPIVVDSKDKTAQAISLLEQALSLLKGGS